MSIYNIYEAPQDKPIWMFTYFVNNEDGSRFVFKPTCGEISSASYSFSDAKFIPYKKGTTEKRSTGFIHAENKEYSDTKEEAVYEYNRMVLARIKRLKEMVFSAEKDLITFAVDKETCKCEIYDWHYNRPPKGIPLWAFAYRINNHTNATIYRSEPTEGEILYEQRFCKDKFFPYKKGTREKISSGAVDLNSRFFAKTKDDAIFAYNELINERIETLRKLIKSAEKDLID